MNHVLMQSTEKALSFAIYCDDHGEVARIVFDKEDSSFSSIFSMYMLARGKPMSISDEWLHGDLPEAVHIQCAQCAHKPQPGEYNGEATDETPCRADHLPEMRDGDRSGDNSEAHRSN